MQGNRNSAESPSICRRHPPARPRKRLAGSLERQQLKADRADLRANRRSPLHFGGRVSQPGTQVAAAASRSERRLVGPAIGFVGVAIRRWMCVGLAALLCGAWPSSLAIAASPSPSQRPGSAVQSTSEKRTASAGRAKSSGGQKDGEGAVELPLSKEFQALLAGLVREHLPAEYVKTTDWGQQKNLTTGVRLRLDGWRLKARRRKKEVNHGSWKRYRITVLNPEKNFKLHVAHVRKTDDGKLAFQVITRAKLRAFGRWSQWQRGIQLVSLSAEADAEVVLRADCRLALRLDPSSIPPDVLLDPEVVSADIRLVDFRLRQLSNVKGRLANQFGKGLERIVEDKLEAKRRELPSKINRQIDKHRDKLRFSLRDLWSSPLREAGSLLSSTNADPASTRNATAGSDKAASDSASTP